MKRYSRQKLRAHDRGQDRHNKGLSLIKKRDRAEAERASLTMKRKPKTSLTGADLDRAIRQALYSQED